MRPDRPPGPLPDPPADLARRALPLRTLSSPWYRFHPPGRPALFFGRTGKGRFDAPAGEFDTLYVAEVGIGRLRICLAFRGSRREGTAMRLRHATSALLMLSVLPSAATGSGANVGQKIGGRWFLSRGLSCQ